MCQVQKTPRFTRCILMGSHSGRCGHYYLLTESPICYIMGRIETRFLGGKMKFSSDGLGWGTLEHTLWCVSSYGSWAKSFEELSFHESAQIGPLRVGLCTWSNLADGTRNLSEVVAYVGKISKGSFGLLATIASTTDPTGLAKTVLVPLPKDHWWHKRTYTTKRLVKFTAEEALIEAQKWAEKRVGLTSEQQNLISEASQMSQLGNEVLQELNLIPDNEEDLIRLN